ncbi:hypothetical protein GCM10010399_61440 [Dactylosporangium fulvum]
MRGADTRWLRATVADTAELVVELARWTPAEENTDPGSVGLITLPNKLALKLRQREGSSPPEA